MKTKILPVVKDTFREFSEDKVLRLSAALAYYAMFSIGPLLVIAVGLAGLAFGNESVRGQLEEQLRAMLGPNSARTIESMMNARQSASVLTTVVGGVALLLGASGVFAQLQDALNTIWDVKAKPGKGLWPLIRQRFLSLTMVLGIGFLLLISLAVTTFLSAVMGSLGSRLPIPEALAHALNFVVSFGIVSLLFAMMFKFLPDVKVPFRKVWIGALVTALLFTIGKFGLSLYLGRESTSSAYGAAGSVIVILMWVYYASVILLLGAEFTQVWAKRTGTEVVPTKYAEPVEASERVREGMEVGGESPVQPRPAGPLAQPMPAFAHSPGGVVRRDPVQFVAFMLVAGLAGGFLFRLRGLRKALRH